MIAENLRMVKRCQSAKHNSWNAMILFKQTALKHTFPQKQFHLNSHILINFMLMVAFFHFFLQN